MHLCCVRKKPDVITEKFDHGYVCLSAFKMPLLIENPTDCEMCSAKDLKTAEIHHGISEVYGENIMNDGMVLKWVRTFNNEKVNDTGTL